MHARRQQSRWALPWMVAGTTALLVVLFLFLWGQSGAEPAKHPDVASADPSLLRVLSDLPHAHEEVYDGVIVWFIRHGQAEHNVRSLDIRDPELTAEGRRQALATRAVLKRDGAMPELVFSSPMTRTLQTSLLLFGDALSDVSSVVGSKGRKKIVTNARLQELNVYPCDTGRPVEELRASFTAQENNLIDYGWLSQQWYVKRKVWENDDERDIVSRMRIGRGMQEIELYAKTAKAAEIAVVAHHGVFRVWLGAEFETAEARRYHLKDGVAVPLPISH